MRRLMATSALAVLGITALVAGCGSETPPAATVERTATAGTTATTASTAPSPQDAPAAVSAGFTTLRAAPYVSKGTATQDVDTSQLPEQLATRLEDAIAAQGTGLATVTRVESPDRVAITQDISGRTQQIVLYDGAVFVSANGTTWAELTGEAAGAFSQASSLARIDPAALFTDITEDGPTDVAGRPATRYDARVDTAKATELVSSVVGGLGDLGSALEDVVTIKDGTATVAVDDANGAVSQMTVTMDVSLDLGAIASAAGQDAGDIGPVGITSTSTETVTDYGGDITVRRPSASTTISTIAGLGEFLLKG